MLQGIAREVKALRRELRGLDKELYAEVYGGEAGGRAALTLASLWLGAGFDLVRGEGAGEGVGGKAKRARSAGSSIS